MIYVYIYIAVFILTPVIAGLNDYDEHDVVWIAMLWPIVMIVAIFIALNELGLWIRRWYRDRSRS